jgi:transcriptional regulator GlxA family with amidase domain
MRLQAPHGLEALRQAGIVVVSSWPDVAERPPEAVLAAVQDAHRRGTLIMGLGSGVFVLAAAGLLDGRPATTHWSHAPTLATRFPEIAVDADVLYVDAGDVITCAGHTAAVDACLHVVRQLSGTEAAIAAARAMVAPPQRGPLDPQRPDPPLLPTPQNQDVAKATTYALAHLDEPLDIDTLAALTNLSRRTFDRRFRATLGVSPLQWLAHQRVLRALRLLESTDLSVDTIARRVGLGGAVSLRPTFRRIVGITPQHYRADFRSRSAPRHGQASRGGESQPSRIRGAVHISISHPATRHPIAADR